MKLVLLSLLLFSCGAGEAIDSVADNCSTITLQGCVCKHHVTFYSDDTEFPCGGYQRALTECQQPARCSERMLYLCDGYSAVLEPENQLVTFNSTNCEDVHQVMVE